MRIRWNCAVAFFVVVFVKLAGLAGAVAEEAFKTATLVVGPAIEDGEKATRSPLSSPFGVDFDGRGNLFLVELEGGRVFERSVSGQLRHIAGDGSRGYTGDGGPAQQATFNGMHNVAVTQKGDIYISDSWNHCVRRIDGRTRTITTVAGTGQPGFAGDGGPATKASFNFLMCVSLNSTDDRLYVADLKNRRIRMIDLQSGIVTTIAGNGKKGIPTNGAVAVNSPLVDPRAVAVDSKHNVYILERGGHALRVVRADGTMHTVAGTGRAGGQDGSALQARLNSPKHLAVDARDRVIIADDQNRRIRVFDPVAKTLTSLLGDGVKSPQRSLRRPHGVCVHADGSVYVVDTGHNRILQLK